MSENMYFPRLDVPQKAGQSTYMASRVPWDVKKVKRAVPEEVKGLESTDALRGLIVGDFQQLPSTNITVYQSSPGICGISAHSFVAVTLGPTMCEVAAGKVEGSSSQGLQGICISWMKGSPPDNGVDLQRNSVIQVDLRYILLHFDPEKLAIHSNNGLAMFWQSLRTPKSKTIRSCVRGSRPERQMHRSAVQTIDLGRNGVVSGVMNGPTLSYR
ncbi:uncharacterized protein N7459_010052 [Penicillium hispanicum]|uniref:uncharacterized protein n=1 Tax=Penicillium hispanicum TaxID=1080232 RepID=UPI0025404AEB|nr:uncharacterized protein N7459_010052 [Penicillium hispanicum]KAJ5570622.1 hypothetical protein N7459_010052 [Penicillium hispanicum]